MGPDSVRSMNKTHERAQDALLMGLSPLAALGTTRTAGCRASAWPPGLVPAAGLGLQVVRQVGHVLPQPDHVAVDRDHLGVQNLSGRFSSAASSV